MITLVLGGVRSGKSEVAEVLAGAGPVTYIATAGAPDGDADFAARIERHRRRRPPGWTTIEEPHHLAGALARTSGPVLVDALGMWVANAMGTPSGRPDVDALITSLRHRDGDVIIVSEEVGLGVHPPTEAGRDFADLLGEVNRRVAEVADRCLLVVAGRVVELPSGGVAGAGPTASGAAATADRGRPGTPGTPAAGATAERGGPEFAKRAGGLGGAEGGTAHPLSGLRSAVAFLTVFGGSASPSGATYGWLPVVGAALGLVLGLVWALADELFGPLAGAAVVVAADLLLTGAIHFDGLVDSADGLLPHLSPERRLAVMAEPGVGAFGVAAGATTLILRTAALGTIAAESGANPVLLAAVWWVSRASMSAAAALLPYARRTGLATAFLTASGPDRAARIASAASIVVAGAALGAVNAGSLLGLPVAAAGAAALHVLARHRIGGYTGDTLGAGGVLAETAGLLAAAAGA